MLRSDFPLVTDVNGRSGYLEVFLSEAEDSTAQRNRIGVVHLGDEKVVLISLAHLVKQEDGSYFLQTTLQPSARLAEGGAEAQTVRLTDSFATEEIKIPVLAEKLTVGKQITETGRVQVKTTVHEREEVVDEPLMRQTASVEVVPIHKLVEGDAPVSRQEGDVLVVPVLEEILVVEKRLFLKEEVHIRREQQTYHAPKTIRLRHEEVTVEREDAASRA